MIQLTRREEKESLEVREIMFASITNKMQRDTIYLFLGNALHVSGGSSAHHQELKTVYTASGYFVKPLLLPATVVVGSSKGLTKYAMLYI